MKSNLGAKVNKMKLISGQSSLKLLKVSGLIVVIASLSACHAMPLHHGNGHSSGGHYSNYGYQDHNTSETRIIRSISVDH